MRKLRELWDRRELVRTLVSRDLKVRYKNSALGFAWSMLTPLMMMAIFTFIFTKVFHAGLKDFHVFFLVGFLPWTYFSNSVTSSVGAIVANGGLIKKVYFPREALPLSTVLAHGVHFLLSFAVLGVYLLIIGYNFLPFLPLLLLIVLLQTLFNAGLAMVVAAANVRFRDLQELIGVIFLLLFYATPIIYQPDMVKGLYRTLLKLNPMTWFVGLYRQALYFGSRPSAESLIVAALAALGFLAVGALLFSRLAVTFAKEV